MVTIRKHGNSGELFDIARFLVDINAFARPDTWVVSIDECMGARALEIEAMTTAGASIPDDEFRALYSGIHQTIDGHFGGLLDGVRVFELRAVDSSYWEVAGSPAFESHMLAKYGAYP